MAVNIGPKIGIDGESEYRKQLQNIIQSTKTLDAQLKSTAKAFDNDTNAKKKAAQQSDLLKKKQENLQKEIEGLKKGVEDSSKKFGENSTQTLKWKENLAKAEAELSDVNRELQNVSPAKVFSDQLAKMSKNLQGVSDKLKETGKEMTTKLTAPIVGAGAGAVKMAADFDTSMSQVQATMGITKDAMSQLDGESVNTMDALRDLAKTMGSETAFSAKECSDAINYLALAGYDTQKVYDTLPTVLNLAAAGNMDLASASDMVTDAMSALGMDTSEAVEMVDKMAKTASSSNTSVEQLGEAILTVGGTAKGMSGGLTEMNAVLGVFANNGIKGAEAGTHLRNILLAMNPATEAAVVAWDELAVSAYDADTGALRPLQDTFRDLSAAMEDLTDEEKTRYLTKMFNKTDLATVQALLKDCGDSFDDLAGKIDDSAGAAQQMADTQLDNLSGQLTILKSALEGAAISIGERLTPYVSKLVGWVQKAVDKFNGLSDEQLQTIITVAGVVAAIGPLVSIIGTVVGAVSSVIGVVSTMSGVLAAGGTVIGAVTTAFGVANIAAFGIVAALAAVVTGGVLLYKNWDTIKAKLSDLKNSFVEKWNAMKNKARETMDSIKNTVSAAIQKIKGLVNFSWSLPKLKLPHFSISGKFSLNPPSIPKINVSWYKRAYDQAAYFNSPTVVPTSAGLKGFGDGVGGEFAIGEAHLMDDLYTVVNGVMGAQLSNIYGLLEAYLPSAGRIYLDGRTLVGATAPQMDRALGSLASKGLRGVY